MQLQEVVEKRAPVAGRPLERVILVEPGYPGLHVFSKFKLPRLGLPLLGAILERELGIRPSVYFGDLQSPRWEDLTSADLVGISTITPTASVTYEMAGQLKRSGVPVVIGGPHVSFLPEEALRAGADFVVRGEGELTFVELVRHLRDGYPDLENIAGLSYLHNGEPLHNPDRPRVVDLTILPWPDLSLIEGFEKSRIIPVLTSRGCPYNCKFCSVTSMFGRRYRFRDNADIMAELESIYARRPKDVYFFYDDNFTASPARTKALLREMKEKGIRPRWTAQAIVKDTELMELMCYTGCAFLYLGLESINPATLEAYRKSQTVEDIIEAVRVIHRYGIKVHGMFVLGSDQDDRSTIRETVRFAKKTGIDTVQFSILTPFPGTETYEELRRDDRIFVDDWSKFSGHHVVFYPLKMSPYILQKEASLRAMSKFYSIWQCWKLGMLFRWRDMAIRIYANRGISRWKSMNREFIAELKRRYSEEKERWKKDRAPRKLRPD
jgi:radical SAM superfamily enzyme YgiQ (UPF0313 family)